MEEPSVSRVLSLCFNIGVYSSTGYSAVSHVMLEIIMKVTLTLSEPPYRSSASICAIDRIFSRFTILSQEG